MADPLPVPPAARSVSVTLHGGDLPWRPVSPMLTRVRLITLGLVVAPALVATVVVGVLLTPWALLGSVAVVLVGLWAAWLVARQVSSISWVELDEEIVIRKGRLFRTLVSVPYGRLQYVDIQSGPLARAHGIASCEIHTASPESDGSLPGLPVAEAEALRARLAARGEAQRAGL
ncbi:MAG TPA: PH domain-containing protein [Ornithinibacter sp.]|nr:PH domain-containing protein [Ornithinibacter sp.]